MTAVARTCPNCDHPLHGLGTFCWNCELPVEDQPRVATAAVLPPPTEKEVQEGIRKVLRERGAAVYDTSQPYRAMITPGLPDLLVFHDGRHAWVEVKAPGKEDELSDAQEDFRRYCREAGIEHHVWRSSEQALEWVTGKRTSTKVEG